MNTGESWGQQGGNGGVGSEPGVSKGVDGIVNDVVVLSDVGGVKTVLIRGASGLGYVQWHGLGEETSIEQNAMQCRMSRVGKFQSRWERCRELVKGRERASE